MPSASSVTTMSATLIRLEVSASSASDVVVAVRARTVGASLTSVTVIVNAFSVERPAASVERTRIE